MDAVVIINGSVLMKCEMANALRDSITFGLAGGVDRSSAVATRTRLGRSRVLRYPPLIRTRAAGRFSD